MIKLLVPAVFMLALMPFSAPAFAASQSSVVGTCSIVAKSKTADGTCISATQSYLTDLKSAAPTLSDTVRDKDIADLVFNLSGLIDPNECTPFNGEVAQAISLASAASSTKDQTDRIQLISTTIQKCDTGTTASTGAPPTTTPTITTETSDNSLPPGSLSGPAPGQNIPPTNSKS